MVEIAEALRARGYRVFTVPEMATLWNQCGAGFPGGKSFDVVMKWEASKLQSQASMEDMFTSYATASNEPTVIISDRGLMDTKAYMDDEMFLSVCEQVGYSEVEMRDGRYDAVVHMMTAAHGAEPFYNLGNNKARRESIEEARHQDERTVNAWLAHPKYTIIDNTTDFATKITRTLNFLLEFLKAPSASNHAHTTRRFLVKLKQPLMVKYVEASLTSTFLTTGAATSPEHKTGDVVIRKRSQGGGNIYTVFRYRSKGPSSKRDTIASATQINSHQYAEMRFQRDATLRVVERIRKSFVYNNQYFEFDTWAGPVLEGEDPPEDDMRHMMQNPAYGILMFDACDHKEESPQKVQHTRNNEDVPGARALQLIPPNFKVIREITNDYSLRNLSK
jgi:hypothetical protein